LQEQAGAAFAVDVSAPNYICEITLGRLVELFCGGA
jgi:hypothetical protein